jgi:Tol biopolymer transport system component
VQSAPAAALPVSRFVITPPATTPLASQNPHDLAISHDGKRIAYVVQNLERNTVELQVRELDALESRPLPGTDTDSLGAMPFFSPDGRSIGFYAGQRGVLSVNIDGRPSARLLDSPEQTFVGAAWDADNTLIYSAWTRLQRGTASGGTPTPLTADRPGGGFVAAPVLLPGGRAVLFVDIDGGSEHVAVLDLETGEEKRLLEGGTVVYSETGHIVFGRGTTLMAAPFNVAELAVTGEPVAVLQGVRDPGPGQATDFALSANGTLVYVPAAGDAESGSAVVWVDRAGNSVERALTDLVNNPRDPHLSPDGTRLLLVTGAPGSDGELWSYDLGGRPPIPLSLAGDNVFPVWSPDSRRVAFAQIEGVSTTVFTLPADGSVLTPQPVTAGLVAPKIWSAGDELIFIDAPQSPANFDVSVRPIGAPDEVRRIVATDFTEFDPALAPNGRWLAYVSNRTGRGEIWVQGYPDGVARPVSTNGGYEPLWSADGRDLYYLQGNALMRVAVETEGAFPFAAPEQLFVGPYLALATPFGSSYDVAKDGRFLMIALPGTGSAAAPASIVVVENWAEELKRLVPTQ